MEGSGALLPHLPKMVGVKLCFNFVAYSLAPLQKSFVVVCSEASDNEVAALQ